MIPILCQNDETKIGFLKDCIRAEVTEERNGSYELVLDYPVTGEYFSDLALDCFIKAKPNQNAENQYFKIYWISKPINGIVTAKGEHISYSLSHYPIKTVNLGATTGQAAINGVLSESSNSLRQPHKFTVGTCDIETLSDFTASACSARAALGGIEGSVLDKFGGEYEFDNYTVNLWKSRGADRGVKIAYRKNMTEMKLDVTLENSYTGIFPYCTGDNDELNMLDEGSIHVQNDSGIAERVLLLDCSSMFTDGEEKNKANLRKHANEYLESNDINAIEGSMSVSMIDLSKSVNYKNLSMFETVSLCDTVKVEHQNLNVTIKMKVIKTAFDVLDEKYKSLNLGTAKADFADTIKKLESTAQKAKESVIKSESKLIKEYKQAIDEATKAITGASGGHVVLNPTYKPSEILILCDSSDISKVKGVWRWNSAGLAYSATGYHGTYGPALLKNGKFVINDVTANTISANLIRAGMLASADGSTYFNLDDDEIVTKSGEYETQIKAGVMLRKVTDKFEDSLTFGQTTHDNITAYLSTNIVKSLTESKASGFGRNASDTDGNLIPIVAEDPYLHQYHSGIITCYDRHGTGYGGSTGQQFAGFRHYRYMNGTQYNAALGIGTANNIPSIALELKNPNANVIARVDLFEHGEPGAVRMIATTYNGSKYYYSTGLELTQDFFNVVSGAYYVNGIKLASATSSELSVGNTGRNLTLYAKDKIICKKKVVMPSQPTIGTSSDENTTVEEIDDIVIPENFMEWFENSEITIQPSLRFTTQSSTRTDIDPETGEEITIVIPETVSEERADVFFDSMETVPDILKDEDEIGVNLFAMVHLEWKAIQELYTQLKTAQEEISTLKQQTGG